MLTKVSKNLITNIDPSQLTTTGATDGQVLTFDGTLSQWAAKDLDIPVSRFVTNYQQILQMTSNEAENSGENYNLFNRGSQPMWFSLKSKMRNPLNKTNPWDSFITKKFSRLFLSFFVNEATMYITRGSRVYYDPAAIWQNVNSPMIADLGTNNPNLTNHKYFYEFVATAGNDSNSCIMKEVFLNGDDDIYVRVDKTDPGTANAAIFIAGII